MLMNKKLEQVEQSPILNQRSELLNSEFSPEADHIELDAIERLKSNIIMLDDLQRRLRFMNNELESLIGLKKKK